MIVVPRNKGSVKYEKISIDHDKDGTLKFIDAGKLGLRFYAEAQSPYIGHLIYNGERVDIKREDGSQIKISDVRNIITKYDLKDQYLLK